MPVPCLPKTAYLSPKPAGRVAGRCSRDFDKRRENEGSKRRQWRLLAALVLVMALAPLAPVSAQSMEPEVVISGLRNPRGLTFDGDTLYVAEAGVGGSGACIGGAEAGEVCYGATGAITALADAGEATDVVADDTHRLIDELPSLAGQVDNPDTPAPDAGTSAAGPHDVSVAPDGTLFFPVGLGADPAVRDELTDGGAPGDSFASLWQAASDGTGLDKVADLGDFEAAEDPDADVVPGALVDTNPFSVLAGETSTVVTDAGANDLLRVDADGTIELVTVFPPLFADAPPFLEAPPGTEIPAQPVPTGVAAGPGGELHVGQLTGFPFPLGAASVFTVETSTAQVEARGFTNIIDVAFGPDENLYVLEIAHNSLLSGDPSGALYRVSDDGATKELLLDELFMPGGLTFGPDDQAYISNCGVCAGEGPQTQLTGHVLRFDATTAEPLITVTSDSAETDEDQAVTVDVLANDAGEQLGVAQIADTGRGAAVVGDDGVSYQPPAHFSGTDTVTYQACAGEHCAVATVAIDVAPTLTDRIAGANRIETAVRTSRAVFPGGAGAVVIARSDQYPDALAGSVLARVVAAPVGAPILLTGGDSLDPATAAEINRLGATTAYVLGGTAAISADTAQAIAESTTVEAVNRINGSNRFQTAAAIKAQVAELTAETVTAVYVAEGEDPDPTQGFSDALAVSALAAHQARPILLVTTDTVPGATADALAGVGSATIVGGTAAVSQEVEDAIADTVDDVDRLEGADRYATSRQVAQAAIEAGLDPELLWLTTGENWPDALTAGPSVARDGGVLLLVHPTDLDASEPTRAFLDEEAPFTDVDIIGGTDAVSGELEEAIRALLME